MYILDKLVGVLPAKLQPYAKAVYPAAVTLIGVGAHAAVTGELNETEIRAAVEGAALSLLAFLFPNRKRA